MKPLLWACQSRFGNTAMAEWLEFFLALQINCLDISRKVEWVSWQCAKGFYGCHQYMTMYINPSLAFIPKMAIICITVLCSLHSWLRIGELTLHHSFCFWILFSFFLLCMKLMEQVGSNSFVAHTDMPFQVIHVTVNGGNGHCVVWSWPCLTR